MRPFAYEQFTLIAECGQDQKTMSTLEGHCSWKKIWFVRSKCSCTCAELICDDNLHVHGGIVNICRLSAAEFSITKRYLLWSKSRPASGARQPNCFLLLWKTKRNDVLETRICDKPLERVSILVSNNYGTVHMHVSYSIFFAGFWTAVWVLSLYRN